MWQPPDSTKPDFWNQRYGANRTPWDQHGVPAALHRFLRAERPRSVLIPGCGSGYEVQAFHEAGWKTRAIDFSPVAVERARAVPGTPREAIRLADFFADDLGGPFDLIYERTFLCSMPPERWPAYARRMAELLRPGDRLAGIFAYGEETEPPPYPITDAAAHALLGKDFKLSLSQAIPPEESLPLFAGKERWQEWERR